MSKIASELKKLKARFVYKTDISQFGRQEHWQVMSAEGIVFGDCEDFALTLGKAIYGNYLWMYLKGGRLVWCRYHGAGHVILKTKEGYADNIQEELFDVNEYFEYSDFKTHWLSTIYFKLLFAKVRDIFS